MGSLAALHTLWIGKELSWIEQLCLSSWLANGHEVTLWVYDPVEGIPEAVKVDNAEKVLPRASTELQRTNHMVANRFRYLLLRNRKDIVWFDADMLLLQPLDDASPCIFGRQASDLVNTAAMRLPCDSPVLVDLLKLIESRIPVPPWWSWKGKLRQRLLGHVGLARPHEMLDWGTFGPIAFTAFLRRHGMFDQALPLEVFYPVPWTKTELYFATPDAVTPLLTEATIAVHLWNRIIDTKIGRDREPPSGSWLANMRRRYNVVIAKPSVSVI